MEQQQKQQSPRGRVNGPTLTAAAVAASAGALFGYDIGVVGGVATSQSFLLQFFPRVAAAAAAPPSEVVDPWCQRADDHLQLFVSSVFLAGLVSSLAAPSLSTAGGRKLTMLVSGLLFLAGIGLSAGAVNLAMLICGRVLVGLAIGLANQSVPLYVVEVAPAAHRGALQILFQLATTGAMLVSQLVNLGTVQHLEPYGWRISLALAAAPALVLAAGGVLLPESPASLVERGRVDEARRVLRRLRGGGGADNGGGGNGGGNGGGGSSSTAEACSSSCAAEATSSSGSGSDEVEEELADLCAAAAAARGAHRGALRRLLSRRRLPELVSACAVAAFSQSNGINAILFWSSSMFASLQAGVNVALVSTCVIVGLLFLGTFVSIALVDRVGRRPLLLVGGLQMLAALVAVAGVLAAADRRWRDAGGAAAGASLLTHDFAAGLVVCMCVFTASFAISWGPCGWLVPAEVCSSADMRSLVQGIATSVNFLVAFVGTQTFLSLLCAMRFGVYLFFGGWVALSVVYAWGFLVETRGVPLEHMEEKWAAHRFWGRVVAGSGGGGGGQEKAAEQQADAAAGC